VSVLPCVLSCPPTQAVPRQNKGARKVGGGGLKADDGSLQQSMQEEILVRSSNTLASLTRVALEVSKGDPKGSSRVDDACVDALHDAEVASGVWPMGGCRPFPCSLSHAWGRRVVAPYAMTPLRPVSPCG
jgi:hypothetical protein